MGFIIGIMTLCASLYYGMTAAQQKTMLAVKMRAVSSMLFLVASLIWFFRH